MPFSGTGSAMMTLNRLCSYGGVSLHSFKFVCSDDKWWETGKGRVVVGGYKGYKKRGAYGAVCF